MMFVRYTIDDGDEIDRKVFTTLDAAKQDYRRALVRVYKEELDLAILFHVPDVDDIRSAAQLVDDVLAGRAERSKVVVLELEQSRNRRMGDFFRTALKDLDLSFLDDLPNKDQS